MNDANSSAPAADNFSDQLRAAYIAAARAHLGTTPPPGPDVPKPEF